MDDFNMVLPQPDAVPPKRRIILMSNRTSIVGTMMMYKAALEAEHERVYAQGSPDIVAIRSDSLELTDIKSSPSIPITLDSLGGWNLMNWSPKREKKPHHNSKHPITLRKKKLKRSVQKQSRKRNR